MAIEAVNSPIRVMALHALAYCERLFYLEEVEEIRIADASVYAGRTLHEERRQVEEDAGELTTLELVSETLGLLGKVDCLRRRQGSLIPYEHKRGRPRRDNGKPAAWESDALQVSAYGMLLEEYAKTPIPEGRIRYHAENVTVRVPLDEDARESVRRAVRRARELCDATMRPPVTENDRLCARCSLAPVCLPEEERVLSDPDWEPIRLFPAAETRKTLHITEPGARVSRAAQTLKLISPDGGKRSFPIQEIGALVLHGYPQITTQALHFCASKGIAVHWISASGRYITGTVPGAPTVQRRIRQFHALTDPGLCLRLTRRLVVAKIENALGYALRTTQGVDREALGLMPYFDTLRDSAKRVPHAEGVDEVRGYEGKAGRAYFEMLPNLLSEDIPGEMLPNGRNRRPPQDRFNALLSFGYALLYQAVLRSVLGVGLDPSLGFYHTPRSSAHPLVLDLMELFRLLLCDIPIIGSVNRHQWDVRADFDIAKGRVWLSREGRRKAIGLFERRLDDTWKHPVVRYSLSYARLIELETRLLEKEWMNAPGLFARMRIR